jgi:hypothetical protein
MKITEFRKLIREEIRKVIKEAYFTTDSSDEPSLRDAKKH